MVTQHALVVEDDVVLANALKELLERKGLSVDVTHCLKRGLELIRKTPYVLGVIDRVLPDGDGLKLVEQAQITQYAMRILMLSGQGWLKDRVAGLEQGASDYVTKPFSYKELDLRVQNLLLSDKRSDQYVMNLSGLTLGPETGELVVAGVKHQLRPRETSILACLLRHRSHLLTREKLIAQVWGSSETQPDYHTLDVYVRRIRAKLGPWKARLQTVRGFGFKLD